MLRFKRVDRVSGLPRYRSRVDRKPGLPCQADFRNAVIIKIDCHMGGAFPAKLYRHAAAGFLV